MPIKPFAVWTLIRHILEAYSEGRTNLFIVIPEKKEKQKIAVYTTEIHFVFVV